MVQPKKTSQLKDRHPAKPPSVLSLFSGCGGMDAGFEASGFRINAMVELEQFACSTLRANFPGANVFGPPGGSGDIRQLNPSDVAAGTIDVLVGGPPCQSFSIAAAQRFLKGDSKFKRIGFKDRRRGTLIREYLRFLSDLKPRVFVIENVPGLMHLDDGAELTGILETCRELGYKVVSKVVQAAEYGVPQYRHRLLMVGALDDTPQFPVPTHSVPGQLLSRPYVTTAEALSGLDLNAPNHVPRNHLRSSVKRYRSLKTGQREPLGRVDRLDPYRPSKTVIAGGSNGGGRSHLHPLLARTLTVRECARLQTFPDYFQFSGTTSRQFTQVGNAVPPLLAEVLARQIGQQFFGLTYQDEPSFTVRPQASSPDECLLLIYEQIKDQVELLYRDTPTPYMASLLGLKAAV